LDILLFELSFESSPLFSNYYVFNYRLEIKPVKELARSLYYTNYYYNIIYFLYKRLDGKMRIDTFVNLLYIKLILLGEIPYWKESWNSPYVSFATIINEGDDIGKLGSRYCLIAAKVEAILKMRYYNH